MIAPRGQGIAKMSLVVSSGVTHKVSLKPPLIFNLNINGRGAVGGRGFIALYALCETLVTVGQVTVLQTHQGHKVAMLQK